MPAKIVSTASLPGLSPVSGKPIVAYFDDGRLSSDGGLLILREIEQRLGVAIARIRSHCHCPRFTATGGADKLRRFKEFYDGAASWEPRLTYYRARRSRPGRYRHTLHRHQSG